jgi:hypothetical protein
MATLAMMMVACSNEEDAVDNGQGKVMTLTTTLKMADNSTTRTLTDEGTQITAAWAIGEEFDINYQKTTDLDVNSLTGSAKATVTALSSGTATVTAQLTDAKDGGAINFYYPYNHTGGTGTDHKIDQKGTLDDINDNFACMLGSGTMSVSGTTVSIDDGGVTMTQEISIWKFTFSDGTNDITSNITNLKLTLGDLTYDVNPTSQPAIYVAIYDAFPYTTGSVTITATTATKIYSVTKPSVTLQVGQMYENSGLVLSPVGLFTVNAGGDKVIFSPGNLQATYNGTSWTWGFAANQWDFVGNKAGNTKITTTSKETTEPYARLSENGTVDLFGWSTNGTYYGIASSKDNNDYGGAFVDWGETISNIWRTLTSDEWVWLLGPSSDPAPGTNCRASGSTVNGASNARYTMAVIKKNNSESYGKGLIVFPDGVTIADNEATAWGVINSPSDFATICTLDQWNALAAKGCVFLPGSGYRAGSSIQNIISHDVDYWSSSLNVNDNTKAHGIYYDKDFQNPATNNPRSDGRLVRLVRDYN